MHSKDSAAPNAAADHKDSSCCDCCAGDNCPMKDKQSIEQSADKPADVKG